MSLQNQDLSRIVGLQQEIVASGRALPELMNSICSGTQDLNLATSAVVEMLEGEEMVYAACTGTLATSGLRLNIHTSLSGLSVKSAEVLYCEDCETDPRVNREACRKVGVIGMASLLSDTPLTQQQSEYVQIITSSAESLLHLVNDIQDFSKIAARKLNLENINYDLKKLVSDIEQMLSHSANKKKTQL